MEPEADCGQERHGGGVREPGAPEESLLTEPRRDRVESLLPIDLEIEERVEEVEAGDPERDRAAEGPRLPRRAARDRDPGADGGGPVEGAEPEVAEPGPALQVRVDDEGHDRDWPEPADDRVQLEDGDEEERKRGRAEGGDLAAAEESGWELARGSARIARVDRGIDQPVQAHRQRAGPDHREGDPDEIVRGRNPTDAEQRADVGERQREDRVLDLDERCKAPRVRDRRR